jgi:hypothetical protein
MKKPEVENLVRLPLSGVDLTFVKLDANRFDEKTVTLDLTNSEARL